MNLEAEAYIERFEYLRNEFKEAIHQKSPDDLIWKPKGLPQVETNSAYVLVTHVAGSEAYHIHELVGKINVNRDRASEFAVSEHLRNSIPSFSQLQKTLTKVGETTNQVLSRITQEELNESFEYGGRLVTIRWAVLHTLEHIGQHLGHLTLTLQLKKAIDEDGGEIIPMNDIDFEHDIGIIMPNWKDLPDDEEE